MSVNERVCCACVDACQTVTVIHVIVVHLLGENSSPDEGYKCLCSADVQQLDNLRTLAAV